MDRAIAKLVGDAGHVAPSLADQLLGFLDPQACIPLHDTVAGLVTEDLLGGGPAHGTVAAYIIETEVLAEIMLQIPVCQGETGLSVLYLVDAQERVLFLDLGILDHQLNEKCLEVVFDQLLAPKWQWIAARQCCEVWIGKIGRIILLRFIDDDRHQTACPSGHAQHFVFKVLHRRRCTDKGDDHQAWTGDAVALHGMELVGLVKDDLPLLQLISLSLSAGEDHPFVHVE